MQDQLLKWAKPGLFPVYLILLLVSGCGVAPPKAVVVPAPVAQPKSEPVKAHVAVIMTSDHAAYKNLGSILKRSLNETADLFNLKDGTRNAVVKSVVGRQQYTQVVAIGIAAAQLAREFEGKQVVFCKVFNHNDYNLLQPWMKGVSMVPPPEQVFKVWKALDPTLKSVGLVTGKGQRQLIADIRTAAEKEAVKILHREVRNDKDFIFTSKALGSSVDGQWLLPDNRVMSVPALREVMAFSAREGRQVIGFDPDLLKIGALASVETIDEDIAQQVLARLELSRQRDEVFGKDITPVEKMDLKISEGAIKRLNLKKPDQYSQFIIN